MDPFRSLSWFPVSAHLDGLVVTLLLRLQEGIIRTNCFDSVDRTNMAQFVISRRVLELILCHVDLMLRRPGLTLELAFPNEDAALRDVWAENGDELCRWYAGSRAMKSSYTRTGRISVLGLMDDATKGVGRYFRNCFAVSFVSFPADSLVRFHRFRSWVR